MEGLPTFSSFLLWKWRPLCKALYENALIYFQSPAMSVIRTLQISVAPHHACWYSDLSALITRLQRSLQRFSRAYILSLLKQRKFCKIVILFSKKDHIFAKNWFSINHKKLPKIYPKRKRKDLKLSFVFKLYDIFRIIRISLDEKTILLLSRSDKCFCHFSTN